MPRYITLSLSILLACAVVPAYCEDNLPRSHPKFKTTRKVFDELIRAIGDGRTRPRLRMQSGNSAGEMIGAWFLPEQNTLTLQERAYDLCASMGPDSVDCLAAILGHELAHYYQDHGWVSHFGRGFADMPVGQLLKQQGKEMAQLVQLETEADVFGGFYGHLAGYNALGVAPRMLQRLYEDYELDEAIPGYPTMQERQQIARRSAQDLRRKIPIFEAGHALLLDRSPEAARCFDYIARDFPSREILNNAGVARALEAVDLFAAGELRFAYPFESDAATRLRSGDKADRYEFDESREERRSWLLEEARDRFTESGRKDPHYTTAFVNLACVAELQGEREEAVDWANKALRIAKQGEGMETSGAHALIARGIAQANGEDPNEVAAREDFTAARSGNPNLAKLNLAQLDEVSTAQSMAFPSGTAKPIPRGEKIHGQGALDYTHIIDAADAVVAQIPRQGRDLPAIKLYARETGDWNGLVVDTGFSTVALLSTVAGYEGATARGLRIGSRLEQIRDEYGQPALTMAGRQSTYHRYGRMSGIVFETDAEGLVTGWMLYGIEE